MQNIDDWLLSCFPAELFAAQCNFISAFPQITQYISVDLVSSQWIFANEKLNSYDQFISYLRFLNCAVGLEMFLFFLHEVAFTLLLNGDNVILKVFVILMSFGVSLLECLPM